MVQPLDDRPMDGIRRAALEAKRPWPTAGNSSGGTRREETRRKAEPIEARLGQNQGLKIARIEFAQTRFDVAANFDELQIGSQEQKLRTPAQASRADSRVGRQVLKSQSAVESARPAGSAHPRQRRVRARPPG